jgi:DNA-binding LytR/AlgR family response regulator
MKVLIVEDEPFAQQEMKRLLSKCYPAMEIVAVLESIEDSVYWFQNNTAPDLIFLDIELSDGSSFEIFNQVDVVAPVIFTTAYNEHALKAFQLNSIDYLLKPIEEDTLQSAINKLTIMKDHFLGVKPADGTTDDDNIEKEELSTGILTTEKLESLFGLSKKPYKTRFMVSMSNDRIGYIDVKDVSYFYAHDSTCFLVTADKRQYIINFNLEQLEQVLDPHRFFRLSRKYITQIDAVAEVHKHFNSRLKVILNPSVNDEVLISRVRVPDFLKWMDI